MAISDLKRERLYAETGGRCGYCGDKIKLPDMTVDHMMPLSGGGSDDEANLLCCCKRCNTLKANRGVTAFRQSIVMGSVGTITNPSYRLYDDRPVWRMLASLLKNVRPIMFYYEKIGLEKRRSETVRDLLPDVPSGGECQLSKGEMSLLVALAHSQGVSIGELIPNLLRLALRSGKVAGILAQYAQLPKLFGKVELGGGDAEHS